MAGKVAVKDQVVEDLLAGITIAPAAPAPERYATEAPERYATEVPDRYATPVPAANRYAAPDRYASPPDDGGGGGGGGNGGGGGAGGGDDDDDDPKKPRRRARGKYGKGFYEAQAEAKRNAPTTIHQTKIILVPGKKKPKGQMLYVGAWEFEDCFRQYMSFAAWQIGMVVDFDAAAEFAEQQWDDDNGGYVPEEDKPTEWRLKGTSTNTVAVPIELEDRGEFWPGDYPEMMELAQTIRARLAEDPERLIRELDLRHLMEIASTAGLERLAMPMEILEAIETDPDHGLGAAALDLAVWVMSADFFEFGGDRLRLMIEEVNNEIGFRTFPQEVFFLHADDLHPGTPVEPSEYSDLIYYTLDRCYAVTRIEYHSDKTGAFIGGQRSIYLEPVGPRPY